MPYRPKEGVEAFESITFFIRFIYAINFEHLLMVTDKKASCACLNSFAPIQFDNYKLLTNFAH